MSNLQAPPPTKHELLDQCAALIRTVDEQARQLNKRWGHNRLPHLVPLEWTERFRSQKRKWEMACFEFSGSPNPDDLAIIRKHGEAMIRAFSKLEDLAVENGYLPTPPAHWEFELKDGTPVILVRDRADMSMIEPDGRSVQIWSLEEVATIIEKFPMIALAKDAFPGAQVVQMKTGAKVIDALDDALTDLPW
jgi:hypothetical protein